MQRLFKSDERIASGIHPSREFTEGILWVDGSNIIHTEDAVRPTLGQFEFIPKIDDAPVTGALEAVIDGVPNLFWGSANKLMRFVQGSGGAIDVSPVGGFSLNRNNMWSLIEWSGFIIATWGGIPYVWPDGGSLFEPLVVSGGGFTTAEIVDKMRVHVLLMNTDLDPAAIHWCDLDDHTDWTPLATNAAGAIRIRKLDSPIRASAPLGTGTAIYGSDAVHLLTYVGSPLYFVEQRILEGIGAVSKKAVIPYDRLNYGFGLRGIWRTDGAGFQYVDRPDMHDFIFSDLNRDKLDLIVAWPDLSEGMLVWFYATEDSEELDRAVGYDPVRGDWTVLAYGRTAVTSRSVWPVSILFNSIGGIIQQTESGSAGGIGSPVIPENPAPMTMPATFNDFIGYGMAGYGEAGYGGTDLGVG